MVNEVIICKNIVTFDYFIPYSMDLGAMDKERTSRVCLENMESAINEIDK